MKYRYSVNSAQKRGNNLLKRFAYDAVDVAHDKGQAKQIRDQYKKDSYYKYEYLSFGYRKKKGNVYPYEIVGKKLVV